MFVEPDGPGYEMPVYGEILCQSVISHCPTYSQQPIHLLSNKQYLAWGGVPVGSQR